MASQQPVRSGEPMELQAPPWSAAELREMCVFMSIDNRTEHCNFSLAGHKNWHGSVQGEYPANIGPRQPISRIKHNPAPNGPSNGGVLYTTDISGRGEYYGFVLAWYFPNDSGRTSNKVYVRGGRPELLTEAYWNEIRGQVRNSINFCEFRDPNGLGFKFTASVNEHGSPAIINLTLEINAKGKKVTHERELKKA